MAAMTRKKNNKKVPLTFSELLELERELEDEQEEREREREREQLEMVNLKWKHLLFNQSPNPSGRRVTWRSNNIHDIHCYTSNDSNKHDTTNSNDSKQSTHSTSNCTMQRNHTTRGRHDILKKDPNLFHELQVKRQLKRKQKRG